MGNPIDPLAQVNAVDAAELRIAVEDMRARQLAGEPVAEDLVRLRNALDRTERKLGIAKPTGKPGPAAPLLDEYFAAGAVPSETVLVRQHANAAS